MRKLRILPLNSITFEEGCNKYLEDCRQRNLREGTINHYQKSRGNRHGSFVLYFLTFSYYIFSNNRLGIKGHLSSVQKPIFNF